jgi:hypothetical protein
VVPLVVAGVALWLVVLVFVVVLCRAAARGDEADPAIDLPAAGRRRALRLARRTAEDASLDARERARSSSQAADALRDVKSGPAAADGADVEGVGDRRARARRR